jgi:tetratricopeptide (TPR) repeat protein
MASSLPQADVQRRIQAIEAKLRQEGVGPATDLAERELALGLEHPLPLNLIAYRHEQARRYGEAQGLLERALKLAPNDVFILNSIGLLHARQDRHGEALRVIDTAIGLRPDFPQAHHSRAQSLAAVGDEAAAMASYRRAAELHPRYAEPRAGLALLHAHRGELDLASRLAAEARAIEPGQAIAGLVQAMVAAERREPAAAESELRALLANPGLDGADRPTVWALLGDALDAQDRPAEAFAAWREGKAEAGARHAGRFASPGHESELDYVSRLTRELPAQSPAVEAGPSPVRGHIFLVGFPRSGTTLLEQILAGHPDVATLDELDLLEADEAELLRPAGGIGRLADLTPEELARRRGAYWDGVARLGREAGGKVLVDKLPLNTIKLPLIASLFPQARILFALRAPRDVVLSCLRRSFRVNAAMYELTSLERAGAFYDAVMGLGTAWRERSALPVLETRYEDLVTDFDAEVGRICSFIGVAWDERLRGFAEAARGRTIRTPSAGQVRRGLYATGKGQWRRYAGQLAPVLPVLEPWARRFGYPADA